MEGTNKKGSVTEDGAGLEVGEFSELRRVWSRDEVTGSQGLGSNFILISDQ